MPGATELDRNNHSRGLRYYDSSAAAAAIEPSPSSPKIPALFRHNRGAAGALILLTVP
jgi:hypothetical protein